MTEKAKRAVEALRTPDASLSAAPNTVRQSIADVIEEQQARIEIIYGLLWNCKVDTDTFTGCATALARKAALELIDKDGQARGIEIARRAIQHKMLAKIPTDPPINPRAG